MDEQTSNIVLSKRADSPRWLPVFICLGVLATTLLLWQNEKTNERRNLEARLKLKAESGQNEILATILPQIQGLERMARRFIAFKQTSKPEWEDDANYYIRHFPFYRAIGWADSSGHLQWITPSRGNEELRNMDLFSEKRPLTAWEISKGKRDVGVTLIFEPVPGEKGFMTYVPIIDNQGELAGYIVGILPLKKLLDHILKNDVFSGISATFYEKELEVYRQGNNKEAVEFPQAEAIVNFFGVSWRIVVRPIRDQIGEEGSPSPLGMLLFGTMMALLLSLSVHFAQVSQRHADKADSAHRELASQIATRKRTEESLQESEDRYRDIMDLVPDMVYRLDPNGCFTYISTAGVNFGLDPEKLIGKHFIEIIHPEDRDLAKFRFNEKRTGSRSTRLAEFRILSSSGASWDCELNEIPIQLNSTGVYRTGAKPLFVGTQGMLRDITEQKKVREQLRKSNDELDQKIRERTQSLLDLNRNLQDEIRERKMTAMALQENEARLRGILDNAPVAIYLKDLQGHYCHVNRYFQTWLNMQEEDILGKSDHDIFPMETADKLLANDGEVIDAVAPLEFQDTVVIQGKARTSFTIKFPLHDATGSLYALCGISADISDRKQAEVIALRFKRVVDNSFNEIYIFDAETLFFVHVSLGARENLGYSSDELEKLTPLDIKPEYSREKFATLVQPLRLGEKSLIIFETIHRRKNGTVYPVEVRLQLSATETPPVFLAIIQDITERQRADKALRKSYQELAYAQKIARMGNWVWDIVSGDLRWTDEVYRIFGLAPQQFGATYEAFIARVHPLDRDFVKNSVNEALSRKKPYSIDHRILLPDNSSVRMVHEQAEIVYSEEGKPLTMLGTVQDITEEHRIKSELEQSREQLRDLYAHLESIREEERTRIAREVHDELGQMLTALKIDLAWTARHLPQSESPVMNKIKTMSTLLETTILAVQRITAELRPQILDVLGLFATIEWEANEFQNRTGIQCWLNLEKTVKIDQQRSTAFFRIIQEALTNIARHAHADNVHIIIKTQNDHLLLEIRDDGKGIEQERIADPKSFGLVGIRERALLLKGEVNFRGSPGKGTTVSIKFPKSF